MNLVNRTPLTAHVQLAANGAGPRAGMIVAKLTFQWNAAGDVQIVRDEPFPLFGGDEATELGLLPMDLEIRGASSFEVILLGCAHAPAGIPTQQMTVGLAVGQIAKAITVFGNREWDEANSKFTNPQPFQMMPLTYEHAYGGSCELEIDNDSVLDLNHPLNRLGKGMDPTEMIESMKVSLNPPEGFPRTDYRRSLPNLEDPLVSEDSDREPEPYCWATIPRDLGFSQIRLLRRGARGELNTDKNLMLEETVQRAHPDWLIQTPGADSIVTMFGLHPEGSRSFQLPQLRVIADFTVGDRNGQRELRPQTLVLLPEENKGYLVYRNLFQVSVSPGTERCMRLRTEPGWFETE